jgi:hypothetical protein
MGASKMRWFNNDGCCQCIGNTCLDYGMNESKCQRCPPVDDYMEDEYYYDADELDAKKTKVDAADIDLAIDLYN